MYVCVCALNNAKPMSQTKEFLERVLDAVASVTEIDKSLILSRIKTAEVVDARYIAIVILAKSGVYKNTIASLLGCTTRNIQNVISRFDARIAYNKPMRICYERVKRLLEPYL